MMDLNSLDFGSMNLGALMRLAESTLARKSLKDFVRAAWPVVEPSRAYLPNWHMDAISEHLQAVSEGKIKRLLINVPPGHAKSLIVSVLWPAWQWIDRPQWRAIFSSYSDELSMRDSVRCRGLVDSLWYKDVFQPGWKLAGDQNAKSWFENTEKGFRLSLSVGGMATGFRGDCLVVDDPLNAKKQHSEIALQEVVFWWDQVMSSRLNDPMNGAKVIIMQRLSERDLSAHVLGQGGYEHVNLPSEYEPERKSFTCIGWKDPREAHGDILFPALYPQEALSQAKREMGSQAYSAQHQQRPSPMEGGLIKRHWWKFWHPQGMHPNPVQVRMMDGAVIQIESIPIPDMHEMAQTWDCAFKDTNTSDFVVGQAWGRNGANSFLLYQDRARRDLPSTLEAVREMSAKYPAAYLKLVEDKANGPAVIQTLKGELQGLVEVNPQGGKVARTVAVSPQIESGNVFLPHPSLFDWVNEYIDECCTFPNGKNDDQLDATTQLLFRWKSGPTEMFPGLRVEHRTEEPNAADHVYNPARVILKDWWPRWISAVHGHASAAHWWCREPSGRIRSYREFIDMDMTPEEFGMGIALRSKEESASLRMVPVWMSEKAFDRTNGKSIAYSMAEGINRSVGANKAFMFVHNDQERDISDPIKRTRAIQNRIDAMPNGFLSVQALRGGKDQAGWDVVREMLRWRPNGHEARPESPDWDYARSLADDVAKFHEYMRQFATVPTEVLPVLVISQECKALIQAMSGAVRSEKDDSALQNSGAGFVLQSLRIGALASREDQGVEPMAEFVGRRMDSMKPEANPISKFLAASKAEDDWENQYAPAPVTFARVTRQGR